MKELTQSVESEIALRFRTVIMTRVSEGLPESAALLGLLSEMAPGQKASFLQRMGLIYKDKSDEQIILLLRSRVKTQKLRFSFYFALLLAFREVIEAVLSDDIQPGLFLESESVIRKTFGDWHFFFALKFFPVHDQKIEERAKALFEELAFVPRKELQVVIPKQENKKLELVLKEREKRIALQETNDQLQSKVRELTKESSQLQEKHKQDSIQLRELKEQMAGLEAKLRQETLRANEAEGRVRQAETRCRDLEWEHEDELRKKEEHVLDLQNQLLAVRDRNWVAKQVMELLREDAKSFMAKGASTDQYGFKDLCAELQVCLKLMESFEQYFFNDKKRGDSDDSAPDVPIEKEHSMPVIPEPVEAETAEDSLIGKFIRKPHGGVIEFGNDESTFITESVVQAAGLEHEAIVSYVSKEGGGHHVSLIMQGDDSRSPVQQVLGYIHLGDHHEFYCVNVNTKESYKLHHKDIEYWDVRDGEPCLFNIMSGYSFARIARMYRNETSSGMEVLQQKHAQETSQKKVQTSCGTIEKFLLGCKIVIVGGLEKWFSSTVEATGADLVHNTGHQPQRVFAEIKKANAVFLLLTANSHKATWGAVEVAKKHNVPHFTIQGSRSNLFSLLWENRQLIASSG